MKKAIMTAEGWRSRVNSWIYEKYNIYFYRVSSNLYECVLVNSVIENNHSGTVIEFIQNTNTQIVTTHLHISILVFRSLPKISLSCLGSNKSKHEKIKHCYLVFPWTNRNENLNEMFWLININEQKLYIQRWNLKKNIQQKMPQTLTNDYNKCITINDK